jgi:predicted RNA-binding protein
VLGDGAGCYGVAIGEEGVGPLLKEGKSGVKYEGRRGGEVQGRICIVFRAVQWKLISSNQRGEIQENVANESHHLKI